MVVKLNKLHFNSINTDCNETELDYDECSCIPIQRIIAIIKIYHKWFNIKDKINFMDFDGNMHGFINHFLTQYESRLHAAYSNVALLNDFHHIIKQHELSYVSSYIKKEIGGCMIDNCQMIKRHYRDKSLCIQDNQLRNSFYFGFGGNSREVNTENILDTIHCHIFHSTDTLCMTPYEIKQLESGCDTDTDEEDEIIDLNTIKLMQIKSILSRKQHK